MVLNSVSSSDNDNTKEENIRLLSRPVEDGDHDADESSHARIDEPIFLDKPKSNRPGHSALSAVFEPCGQCLRTLPRFITPGMIRNTLITLLPSFVRSRYFPTEAEKSGALHTNIPKIAYLDGLRGLASVSVVIYHAAYTIFPETPWGWRSGKKPEQNDHILLLPFFRLLFSGNAAVAIFFVVSGFALSIKPVRQMRDPDTNPADILKTVSSAALRRPFRLYIPTFVATFIPFILIRMGLYDAVASIRNNKQLIQGGPPGIIKMNGTFTHQLADWTYYTFGALDIIGDPSYPSKYNGPIWTIPVEFVDSLVIYLTHVATCGLQHHIRVALTAFLALFAIFADRPDLLLFWSGFLLADLDGMLSKRGSGGSGNAASRTNWRSGINIALLLTFIVGLYLTSYPQNGGKQTPGFVILSSWIPSFWSAKNRWWTSIGAIMVVFSVSRLPPLGRFFSLPLIRYLGNISFGLYLVHWWLLHIVGYPAFYIVWTTIGRTTTFQIYFGFLVAFSIFFMSCIWVGDVFWRLVDLKSVKFAQWLERKCLR